MIVQQGKKPAKKVKKAYYLPLYLHKMIKIGRISEILLGKSRFICYNVFEGLSLDDDAVIFINILDISLKRQITSPEYKNGSPL